MDIKYSLIYNTNMEYRDQSNQLFMVSIIGIDFLNI